MSNKIVTNRTEAKIILSHIDERAERLKKEILESESKVEIIGTKYYASESGDDSNDGLSPETPVKSFEGVMKLPLKVGDGVLFKRGDTFRGQLLTARGVTYTAYGEGEKPRFYNSLQNYADPAIWEKTDVENVYKLTIPITYDAGVIVFDEGKAWSEKRIKGRKNFVEGKLSELDCDLCMWHDVPVPMKESGYVYLRSDKGNPGERFSSIEIATRRHIVVTNKDVTIDNICLKYGAAHGIGGGSNDGITVQYCEFGFIGGAWFRTDTLSRYGNAIEIYGGCRGFTCDHNYIYQIYDAGITQQYKGGKGEIVMVDVKYTNNLIEDTSYSIEYFLTDAEEEPEDARPERYIKNFDISGNIMRRAGYGFGSQRPDKSGAAHIKGWNHYNKAWNYTIHNNIFDRGTYMALHIGADEAEWLPDMKGNIYVTAGEENCSLGLFGKRPVEADKIFFDENVGEALEKIVGEKDGMLVYID